MKGCLWSYLYARKKIRVTRHVKHIIWKETYKSLDFWEIHSQNPVGIWFKNTYFWGEFFSKSLKKFFSRRIVTFNISGRLSKIISLLSKKIGVIRHIDQKILTKNQFALKKNRFGITSLCTTVSKISFRYLVWELWTALELDTG